MSKTKHTETCIHCGKKYYAYYTDGSTGQLSAPLICPECHQVDRTIHFTNPNDTPSVDQIPKK